MNSQCPKLPWMIDFHSSDQGETLDRQYKAATTNTCLDHLSSLTYRSKPSIFRSTQLFSTLVSSPEFSNMDILFSAGVSVVRISNPKIDIVEEIITKVRLAVENYSRKIGRVYSLGIALEIRGPVIQTGICYRYT